MSPEFIHINSFSDNVALYKPAMQSSTYVKDGHDMLSAWAVDGNADPVFANYHCSCTLKTYEPWWAVDLGAPYTVLKVCLTNRQNPTYGKGNGKAIPLEIVFRTPIDMCIFNKMYRYKNTNEYVSR